MAIGKRRALIGWKRIDVKALFVHNLKVENEFFLLVDGGVRSFEKSDIIEKNTRNQFFVKLFLLSFHLSAFEINFIKTSNPALYHQKEFIILNLKVVHKRCFHIDPFPANNCSPFSYSRSFSCALYSDVPLDKWEMKSMKNINLLIEKLVCLKNVFLGEKALIWKKNTFLKTKI